jgi:predicted alpha/beta-fold hydrolase
MLYYLFWLILLLFAGCIKSLLNFNTCTEYPIIMSKNITTCKPFTPLFFAKDSFSQTCILEVIYGFLYKTPKIHKIEKVTTNDNQTILLHWFGDFSKKLILVFSPGLGGEWDASYIKPWFYVPGITGVVVSRRGYHEQNRMNHHAYHVPMHTDCEDMEIIFKTWRHRYPNAKIVSVGYSSGGGHGLSNQVDACVFISCNFDLSQVHDYLEQNTFMDGLLHINIKKTLTANNLVPPNAKKLTDINEILAKKAGYTCAREYYNSTKHDLFKLKVPTLFIMSLDDPLMVGMMEYIQEVCAQNDKATAIITQRGGHLAWISNEYKTWITDVVQDYLLAIGLM